MEEKEKKNPYGVFNPDTKKWDGAEKGTDANDYINKRQLYGGDEWATGKGKAKELYGNDYGKAKEEWLAEGKSAEGFSANYFAGGDEGTLGGKRHKAGVDRNLRAQANEKEWRAGQAAGYEKLGEDGQRKAGLQAYNNIKKDKDLYSKVRSDRADAFGVKDLFNKMHGGGGYGGTAQTLSGEERAKMVEGLEKLGINPGTVFRDLQSKSPMKRMGEEDSPFKRTPQIRRSNYVNLSNQIGSSVQGAIDERRAQQSMAMEEERQARAAEMQTMQMAQLKQAQYESLNVPADTGIKSADQYISGASRQMVDAQSALVNSLKAGDIDTDEFASKSALIKSQIPALAKTKEALTGFQSNYTELLSQGKISKADDGKAAELYNLIQSGEMLIQPDEKGHMMMTNPDGSVSVPLSQIHRIPNPTPLAPELAEVAKGPLAQIGDGPFDAEIVNKAVDNLFTGDSVQDEKTLKAFAVDRLGMSLEKANELLATSEESDTGATNALEAAVEKSIFDTVQVQYDVQQRKKQEAEALVQLRQAQADNQKRLANGTPDAKNTAAEINHQLNQQQAVAGYNSLMDTTTKTLPANGVFESKDAANSFTAAMNSKLPPGVSVEYDAATKYFGTTNDFSKAGNIVLKDSDGEVIQEIPSDNKQLLDNWLKKIAGVSPG